jgi:hypothetical protein
MLQQITTCQVQFNYLFSLFFSLSWVHPSPASRVRMATAIGVGATHGMTARAWLEPRSRAAPVSSSAPSCCPHPGVWRGALIRLLLLSLSPLSPCVVIEDSSAACCCKGAKEQHAAEAVCWAGWSPRPGQRDAAARGPRLVAVRWRGAPARRRGMEAQQVDAMARWRRERREGGGR